MTLDVFRVDVGAGDLEIDLTVAALGPMLDARVTISRADGTVVAQFDPADTVSGSGRNTTASGLGVSSVTPVTAGTYFITVEGVGFGDTSTNTATATPAAPTFGSLGRYTLALRAAEAQTGLTVVVSSNPTQVSAAGETVTFTATVTNTGSTPVTNPTVDVSAFTGNGTAPSLICPTAPIAAGASVTCTGSYVVVDADIPQGQVRLTVTAAADLAVGSVSAPASAVTVATAPPASGGGGGERRRRGAGKQWQSGRGVSLALAAALALGVGLFMIQRRRRPTAFSSAERYRR